MLLRLILREVPLWLAAAALIVGLAINFTNVVGRYLFRAPIYWADEAMIYLAIWSIFLAAIAVTYDRADLTMDLFSTRLSPRLRWISDFLISAASIATFLFMAWQSLTVSRLLIRNGQKSLALEIPMFLPQASLLVGFTMLAIVVAVRFIFRTAAHSSTPPNDKAAGIEGASV